MQNISAVFENIGLPIIKGYLPAKRVGAGVTNEIVQIINETDIFNNLFPPTFDNNRLEENVKIIRKLSNSEIPPGISIPKKRKQETESFARDPKVKAFVLQRASGVCEQCKENGPFMDKNGYLFLEVHHLLSMALGGEDTIYNTVALCPNCHRELHYGVDAPKKTAHLRNYLDEIYA